MTSSRRNARLPGAAGFEAELEAYRLPDGAPIQLFHILAHSPAALADLRSATARALQATSLEPRLRELLVLRVLYRRGAESEIAVHLALFGAETGFDQSAVRQFDSSNPDLSPLERDLVSLADAIAGSDGDVDDDLWTRLLESLGTSALVDALFVATQYVKIALLVRALRIPTPTLEETP